MVQERQRSKTVCIIRGMGLLDDEREYVMLLYDTMMYDRTREGQEKDKCVWQQQDERKTRCVPERPRICHSQPLNKSFLYCILMLQRLNGDIIGCVTVMYRGVFWLVQKACYDVRRRCVMRSQDLLCCQRVCYDVRGRCVPHMTVPPGRVMLSTSSKILTNKPRPSATLQNNVMTRWSRISEW